MSRLRISGTTSTPSCWPVGQSSRAISPVPGRELGGIHFAMEFLPQQNRRNLGDSLDGIEPILATGKHVVIIGGGDTGADCLGTCHRQKPKSVSQFEIMPQPPPDRAPHTPWPLWPLQLRTEGAHEEGGNRDWSIATTHFTDDGQGNVKLLHGTRVGPPPTFEPIAGTEFTMEADLVLLAMGFTRTGTQRDDRAIRRETGFRAATWRPTRTTCLR